MNVRILLLSVCAVSCLTDASLARAAPGRDDGQNDNRGRGQQQGEQPGRSSQGRGPQSRGPQSRGPQSQGPQGQGAQRQAPLGQGPRGQGQQPGRGPQQGQGARPGPQPSQPRPAQPRPSNVQRPAPRPAANLPRGALHIQPAPASRGSRSTRIEPQPNIQATQQRPPLSGWSRAQPPEARATAGQQWRSEHRGWDQSAVWAGNRNWWRGDSAFRQYRGVRLGFFFVPARGYVAAPQEYRNHYWAPGAILPNWFWSYEVVDYSRYGLPQPPEGCLWVWVDDDLVLIDRDDGYILDVVRGVW